ncbi:hypothetical protein MKW98_019467 [Papaver atlanticum]|uniref:Uncharacterized protein n=1 Tax=Papaver atlanticum TaxID=357466 RepID=A0AAD4XA44_9MAGN|nr:hypothetical protein MKW98_019467 [Papaver atlanticum]
MEQKLRLHSFPSKSRTTTNKVAAVIESLLNHRGRYPDIPKYYISGNHDNGYSVTLSRNPKVLKHCEKEFGSGNHCLFFFFQFLRMTVIARGYHSLAFGNPLLLLVLQMLGTLICFISEESSTEKSCYKRDVVSGDVLFMRNAMIFEEANWCL